ncbi:MAG: metal-dependent transcriptional regulator [Candidatus Rokubacteria bacterium]|nr:metal-dependent transcriptional regulator [Candidatus Rokubacteria bacterium]
MASGGRLPEAALLESVDAVYRLDREGSATIARLAKRLHLEEEAAKSRVVDLEDRGLVSAEGPDRLVLTKEGERVALGLVRRHRLLERFLTDTLGLPWHRVHEEATRLTPVLADDIADALARHLGAPATCPHGNPIPSADGTPGRDEGTPLHRLRAGQSGTILRIEREEPEVLKYLAALGLLPQTSIEVEEVAPFGGPILVRSAGSRYALGRKVAARILVRPA